METKQKAVLECITDASLTDKQKKALKCSYEGLLNNAELEAQKIKKDRDDASQSKLEEHPAKRQRTESYRYDIDHTRTNPPRDVEHFTEVLTRTTTDRGETPSKDQGANPMTHPANQHSHGGHRGTQRTT